MGLFGRVKDIPGPLLLETLDQFENELELNFQFAKFKIWPLIFSSSLTHFETMLLLLKLRCVNTGIYRYSGKHGSLL